MLSAYSIPPHGCAIISIEALQRRKNKKVDWTKLMNQAPRGRTSLAFFLGPNESKTLVMVRNYGAIEAVLLSDDVDDLATIIRIPVKVAAEFLEPYCNDVVNPELNEYYDKIQLHLSKGSQTLLGPLSSARAAYAMQKFKINEAEAIDIADQQSKTLLAQHAERNKAVDDLLAAQAERTSGFSNSTTGKL